MTEDNHLVSEFDFDEHHFLPENDIQQYTNSRTQDKCDYSTSQKTLSLFPGPAGIIHLDKTPKADIMTPRKCVSANMEYMYFWNKMLANLQVKVLWETSRSNLNEIKIKMIGVKFYLRIPILIVSLKKIMESQSTSSSDIICVMQDPTDEVKGHMHQDVITDYRKLVQEGNIFILHRPTIFIIYSKLYIAITKKNILAIFSQRSAELVRFQSFNEKDLESWLSYPIEDGDNVSEMTSCRDETTVSLKQKSNTNISLDLHPFVEGEISIRVNVFSAAANDSTEIFEAHAHRTQCEKTLSMTPSRKESPENMVMGLPTSPIDSDYVSHLLDGIDTDLLFDEF